MKSRSGRNTAKVAVSREKSGDVAVVAKPLRSTGVDWLTASCSDKSLREGLESRMTELLFEQREAGNDVKPWRLMQFEGMAAGPVGYGISEDMSIVRLSSDAARSHWREILPLTTNCSRIDLQVTIAEVDSAIDLIAEHEQEALAHVAHWLRPPEVTLRKSNRTGLTLYLNRRVSERFGRVYDKAAESKDEAWSTCVRYEVQFNGEAGKLMAATLATDAADDCGISGRVHRFFLERGCALPWQPEELRFNESVPRSRSDVGRRLRWLNSQVKPAVSRLIADGRRKEVLEALGLSDVL